MNTLGDPDAWQDQRASSTGAHPTRGLLGYLRRIFTEPFISAPEQALQLSAPTRERRRRAALLRLFLLSIAVLAGSVVLPPALALGAPAIFVATVGLDIVLACLGLVLLRLDHLVLAAGVFIYGALAVGVLYLLRAPTGLDELVLLVFATLALLILLAGLVLPSLMIWLTAGLVIAVTSIGMLTLPIAGSLMPGATSQVVRWSGLGLLVGIQSLAALISWVSARSARAGVESVAHALERERELTALKDQFIIAANHELRSPIMAMYGNIELLAMMQESANTTEEQRTRAVARALQSGDTVLSLLTSVLDASFMEATTSTRLSLRPVALAATVRRVLETFDPREIGEPGLPGPESSPTRSVRVDIATNLAVVADEQRLRQVLINLVANALKYSAPGSPIAISAAHVPRPKPLLGRLRGHERAASTTADIQVYIRDRGLGVPPSDAAKLFNRFVRLERDIAGPVRGTGMGLYLCRTLIEAMGGRIWVESSGIPGEGSAFCFTLPSADATAPLPAEEAGDPVPAEYD